MTHWLKDCELNRFGIRLEILTSAHTDELRMAIQNGDLGDLWFTLVPKAEETESFVNQAVTEHQAKRSLPFLVRSEADGSVLGSTRFCNIDQANQRAEIGHTWLIKRAQRTLVNSACKFLLLEYAFEDQGAIAIEFRTHWHNRASRAAIQRLGAKEDGVLRQHRRDAEGRYRDTVVYSILNSEWPTCKQGLQTSLDR